MFTPIQKRVALLAVALFSCIALGYLTIQYCLKVKKINKTDSEGLDSTEKSKKIFSKKLLSEDNDDPKLKHSEESPKALIKNDTEKQEAQSSDGDEFLDKEVVLEKDDTEYFADNEKDCEVEEEFVIVEKEDYDLSDHKNEDESSEKVGTTSADTIEGNDPKAVIGETQTDKIEDTEPKSQTPDSEPKSVIEKTTVDEIENSDPKPVVKDETQTDKIENSDPKPVIDDQTAKIIEFTVEKLIAGETIYFKQDRHFDMNYPYSMDIYDQVVNQLKEKGFDIDAKKHYVDFSVDDIYGEDPTGNIWLKIKKDGQ